MSICLLLIWIASTDHTPALRVCGHKIEAWDPRHNENPRNEGPNGNAPNERRAKRCDRRQHAQRDARNEDATYGNAPNVMRPHQISTPGTISAAAVWYLYKVLTSCDE
ncbi:hypothetical protein BS47DRAFT_1367817 [Hydnum rufescens UP504]|uniref:Secreted protein n=1 Tax=Hydnum rufescens UP504 TaxID=1448309 RepID=A0A9P6DPN8_9AGAM|nr:hypothetical protein BS47DRAFT_1367817 [Hydnum rufescens UP504]